MDKNDLIQTNKLQWSHIHLEINRSPSFQVQGDDWEITNALYSDFNLFIVRQGRLDIEIGGKREKVEQGQAFLVPPLTRFEANRTSEEKFIAMAQHFDLHYLLAQKKLKARLLPEAVTIPKDHHLWKLYNLYQSVEAQQSKTANQALFTAMFWSLVDLTNINFFEELANSPLLKMVHYMDHHFLENDALSRTLSLNAHHHDYSAAQFKKLTGQSPKKYMIKKRLDYACRLLHSEKMVKEVAHESGFEDELYFSRKFKERLGLSPSQFKQSLS